MFPEPITDERREQIIEAMANRIKQFGMVTPAIFFLEANKPISYIGGQAMHFFSPIIGIFFNSFEDYAFFFDDRNNVELLIQRLESIALEEEKERQAAKAAKRKARVEAKKAKQAKKKAEEAADNAGKDIVEEEEEITEKKDVSGKSLVDEAIKIDPDKS
jgi:hypothetical protein